MGGFQPLPQRFASKVGRQGAVLPPHHSLTQYTANESFRTGHSLAVIPYRFRYSSIARAHSAKDP